MYSMLSGSISPVCACFLRKDEVCGKDGEIRPESKMVLGRALLLRRDRVAFDHAPIGIGTERA